MTRMKRMRRMRMRRRTYFLLGFVSAKRSLVVCLMFLCFLFQAPPVKVIACLFCFGEPEVLSTRCDNQHCSYVVGFLCYSTGCLCKYVYIYHSIYIYIYICIYTYSGSGLTPEKGNWRSHSSWWTHAPGTSPVSGTHGWGDWEWRWKLPRRHGGCRGCSCGVGGVCAHCKRGKWRLQASSAWQWKWNSGDGSRKKPTELNTGNDSDWVWFA